MCLRRIVLTSRRDLLQTPRRQTDLNQAEDIFPAKVLRLFQAPAIPIVNLAGRQKERT